MTLAFAMTRGGTNDWTITSYDENWAEAVVAEHLNHATAMATVEASNEAGTFVLVVKGA
jgi:hypothetical protein